MHHGRHTFFSHALAGGRTLAEARDAVGHSNVSITSNNSTGRNDFLNAKVTKDNDNAYFFIETAENISSQTDQNWMMLFIDSDLDSTTGWNGYDYVVNRSVIDLNNTTLHHTTDGSVWNNVGTILY